MLTLFKHKAVMVLFILASLVFFGCDENSTQSDDNQVSDEQIQESAEAVEYSTMYIESVTAPASALVAVTSSATSGALFKQTAVTSDTIFTGCPTAIYNVLLKQLVLDYGSGCSGAGDISHSGSIVLTGSFSGTTLSFASTFNEYTANNFYLNGNVTFIAGMDSIEITIANGTIAYGDTTVSINAELKLKIDTNGTPGDIFDDVYVITGFGTVITTDGSSYSFEITTPLEYHALCQYPVKGVVEVKTDSYTAEVDFFPNSGSCDDIDKVTIGKYSKTISLYDL